MGTWYRLAIWRSVLEEGKTVTVYKCMQFILIPHHLLSSLRWPYTKKALQTTTELLLLFLQQVDPMYLNEANCLKLETSFRVFPISPLLRTTMGSLHPRSMLNLKFFGKVTKAFQLTSQIVN